MQLSFHLQFFVSTKDGFRRWHVHVFGEGGNQVYESDISFNFAMTSSGLPLGFLARICLTRVRSSPSFSQS